MMLTKANHYRRNVEQTEIVRVIKLHARDLCIKVTEKRSTTSEATELGVLRVLQLALYLSTKIV
jgi:hypothetical protein